MLWLTCDTNWPELFATLLMYEETEEQNIRQEREKKKTKLHKSESSGGQEEGSEDTFP